jgi:hypothetical protein
VSYLIAAQNNCVFVNITDNGEYFDEIIDKDIYKAAIGQSDEDGENEKEDENNGEEEEDQMEADKKKEDACSIDNFRKLNARFS